ncbi:hypothetical protein [Ralstonia pseudosolanacearum]|uniref:hypothetical protein n=1 Tax=Ralstonia pseudosolanacearum TaxID=1310165 RepID=UPI003221E9A5
MKTARRLVIGVRSVCVVVRLRDKRSSSPRMVWITLIAAPVRLIDFPNISHATGLGRSTI